MGDSRDGKESEGAIKAISGASVHRICSGQVILDPSSALKELVENSVDSGCTKIEVKLKEYGLESLEVSDNGSGIHPDDYEMLAQKHTTSKLREFDDLTNLNTFGFRGEALSSLCAISESVTVHTRCKEQAIGVKLEYDRDGKLKGRTNAPRDVGTTVTLLGLFTALPVRHKDFLKNKTREYQRLLRRLQGYALIHSDKRFVCSNQTAKARHNVLTTHGTGKMLDCLTSIFGAKQKDSVAEVRLECGTKVVIEGLISKGTANTGLSTSDRQFLYLNKRPVDVPKLSKVFNEVYKSFNTGSAYPIFVLNLTMPFNAYDVNVTPDKRQIMFHDEKAMVEEAKLRLQETYEPSRGVMAVNAPVDRFQRAEMAEKGGKNEVVEEAEEEEEEEEDAGKGTSAAPAKRTGRIDMSAILGGGASSSRGASKRSRPEAQSNTLADLWGGGGAAESEGGGSRSAARSSFRSDAASGSRGAKGTAPATAAGGGGVRNGRGQAGRGEGKRSGRAAEEGGEGDRTESEEEEEEEEEMASAGGEVEERDVSAKRIKVGASRSRSQPVTNDVQLMEEEEEEENAGMEMFDGGRGERRWGRTAAAEAERRDGDDEVECEGVQQADEGMEEEGGEVVVEEDGVKGGMVDDDAVYDGDAFMDEEGSGENMSQETVSSGSEMVKRRSKDVPASAEKVHAREREKEKEEEEGGGGGGEGGVGGAGRSEAMVVEDDEDEEAAEGRSSLSVAVDWQAIIDGLPTSQAHHRESSGEDKKAEVGPKKREGIDAEALSLRVVDKEDFAKMQVLGQFNLGFIIARLRGDLYILDQHACDEKYRYETLQKSTTINTQPLVVPKRMELEPADEMVVSENLEVFKASGFELSVDDEAPPGQRVRLIAVPFSKGTVFGPSDVHEMICLLRDNPGEYCRPSRVNSMFASRACRSAIMIGTAMTADKMRVIVDHMGTMDQPWNCPHGRPTMRHLYDLAPREASSAKGMAYKGPEVVR